MESPFRIGVLYPSTGAEDDYFRMARLLTPRAEVVMAHTEGPDRHEPHIGRLVGSSKYLLAGAGHASPRHGYGRPFGQVAEALISVGGERF